MPPGIRRACRLCAFSRSGILEKSHIHSIAIFPVFCYYPADMADFFRFKILPGLFGNGPAYTGKGPGRD
jgi:hypothetical protein